MINLLEQFKVDSYYFGVVYKENLTPLKFIEKINNDLVNMFNIKVYYTKESGYNESLTYLSCKLKQRKNERYKFIAFLHIEECDIYIPVVQHSNAKYITFEFYGLEQYNEKSKIKMIYLKKCLNKLFEKNYKVKIVKVDFCYDFRNESFEDIAERYNEHFKTINKFAYIYESNETVYFNSKVVNDCIIKQKSTKENLSSQSKNNYLNIVLYNKAAKHKLNFNLTRLEFSFKSDFFGKFKYKNIFSMEDFYFSLNQVKEKLKKHLLVTKKVVNNEDYLGKKKVI